MIVCGWCHASTPEGTCSHCGRDPRVPWEQRALAVPEMRTDAAGRPVLDPRTVRRRLRDAARALTERGSPVTVSTLAEQLEVSDRTVRRWQQMSA